MAKLILSDLVNLENQTSTVATINSNNTDIENAIENTLSRDGSTPNQMGATLDMNSNRVINLPAPLASHEPARLQDVEDLLAEGATNILWGSISGTLSNQTDLNAQLQDFIGDTGSGGTKGMVPAPASGDGASSKFLKADGTWSVPTGSGVTDHGALTGLADDDHTQYHNDARGDARYTPIAPTTLGINTTADTTDRLSVVSAQTHLKHDATGNHLLRINKEEGTDTANIRFQTSGVSHAEIGTLGSEDLKIRVSTDGSTWTDAILIDNTTGACTFPNSTTGTGTVTSVATGTGLTGGPITGSGTISMANMPASTIKGNNTGGSDVPVDMTGAETTALLSDLIGDSGSGGTKGLAPAPASGDAAAGKFLKADGTWALPPTASGVSDGDKGDITVTSGVWTIDANVVTNAKLDTMAANTIKGNDTGGSANPTDLTVTALMAMTPQQPTVQFFTSSGTWTRPAGCRRIRVRVLGGGGGGGGALGGSSQAGCGLGGGAGSYSEGIYDVTSTSSASVTVGAAGSAGSATPGFGGNGGTSSFGSLITGVAGGNGGGYQGTGTSAVFTNPGTASSAGSGGDINTTGPIGGQAIRLSGTTSIGGIGASSAFGTGGRPTVSTAAGGSASGYGSGGAGGNSLTTTGQTGGAGSAGFVIVEEFY